MTKTARPISPFSEASAGKLTPNSLRTSPSWPTASKGRKMAICFECERSNCICERSSQHSVTLCSEDDIRPSFQEEEADLSFISADGSGPDIVCHGSLAAQFIPPPREDIAGSCEEAEVFAPPADSDPAQDSREGDRRISVGDYRRCQDGAAMPDLCVFSVCTSEDVTIPPLKSAELDTNIIIHPEPLSVQKLGSLPSAQFNFCPLGPDAKNASLAARACQIVGGPIYVGTPTSKRLRILISNPGSYAPIFLPCGSLVGVMEIFHTRY